MNQEVALKQVGELEIILKNYFTRGLLDFKTFHKVDLMKMYDLFKGMVKYENDMLARS